MTLLHLVLYKIVTHRTVGTAALTIITRRHPEKLHNAAPNFQRAYLHFWAVLNLVMYNSPNAKNIWPQLENVAKLNQSIPSEVGTKA